MDEIGPSGRPLIDGFVVFCLEILYVILRIGVMITHYRNNRETFLNQVLVDHFGDSLHLSDVAIESKSLNVVRD